MANITGTTGNDNLVGTDDDDSIDPVRGVDTVDGLGGSDRLIIDYSTVFWDPFAGAAVPGSTVSTISSDGGSFSGVIRTDNLNHVTFSNIEHLHVKLDFWQNTVI